MSALAISFYLAAAMITSTEITQNTKSAREPMGQPNAQSAEVSHE
jgi:hypothetical protein